MKQTALLIIDMQVGARELTNPHFFAIEEIIGKLQKLIQQARKKGIPIVYAQHHNPNGFPAYGSHAWQLIPETGPTTADTVIQKSTPDVFFNTHLHAQLQSYQIRQLVIAGIQTQYCIDTTCRRAYSLGYDVILVKDGHTTVDSPVLKASQIIEHHNHTIGTFFGKVTEAASITFE